MRTGTDHHRSCTGPRVRIGEDDPSTETQLLLTPSQPASPSEAAVPNQYHLGDKARVFTQQTSSIVDPQRAYLSFGAGRRSTINDVMHRPCRFGGIGRTPPRCAVRACVSSRGQLSLDVHDEASEQRAAAASRRSAQYSLTKFGVCFAVVKWVRTRVPVMVRRPDALHEAAD